MNNKDMETKKDKNKNKDIIKLSSDKTELFIYLKEMILCL